jgi:hypothetical protein
MTAMATTAFTRFDPRAFLENQDWGRKAVKAAKPAKVTERAPEQTASFATFATFAGAPAKNHTGAAWSDDWTEAHDERAAVIEHDGGAPQDWAEALARLDLASPPADVPPRRWLAFVDDCGRFLDAGWAARAAALGWSPLDLFGCNRERPYGRIDHMGLLWLLNGGRAASRSSCHSDTRRRPADVSASPARSRPYCARLGAGSWLKEIARQSAVRMRSPSTEWLTWNPAYRWPCAEAARESRRSRAPEITRTPLARGAPWHFH